DAVFVRVLTKAHTNLVPISLPYGQPLKLSEMNVVSCPSGARGNIIQGAMQIRQSVVMAAGNSKDELLEVGFVHQVSDSEFQVKLLLKGEHARVATFKPNEDSADGTFISLGVSKHAMKIPLPSPVKLINCKIHRKSGFLLLTFKKHFRPFPLAILSTKNLPHFPPNEVTKLARSLGVMFTDEYRSVKTGDKSIDTLSKVAKTMYGFKDNLQLIFTLAYNKKQWILLTTKYQGLGIFGTLYCHGVCLHHAVDSAHLPTPMLDASWVLFETLEEAHIVMKIHKTQPQCIDFEEWEFHDFKELVRFFWRNSCEWDRGVGREIPKPILNVGGKHIFKRCLIHPVYNVQVKAFLDKGSEEKSLGRKVKEEAMNFARKVKTNESGNPFDVPAFREMMEDIQRDPDAMRQLTENMKSFGFGTGSGVGGSGFRGLGMG
ncbi:hypothetical protein HDU76_008176, partial [Blyttiomyces sp. JEL0837]